MQEADAFRVKAQPAVIFPSIQKVSENGAAETCGRMDSQLMCPACQWLEPDYGKCFPVLTGIRVIAPEH